MTTPARLRLARVLDSIGARVMASVRRVRGGVLAISMVLVVVAASACAAVDPGVVNSAVSAFHQHFNADEWVAVYDDADPSFRATTPRETFIRIMSSLKSRVGTFQNAEQRSYVIQAQAGDNAGTYVRVTYDSTFMQRSAVETFAWRIDNSRALLFFYDAQ